MQSSNLGEDGGSAWKSPTHLHIFVHFVIESKGRRRFIYLNRRVVFRLTKPPHFKMKARFFGITESIGHLKYQFVPPKGTEWKGNLGVSLRPPLWNRTIKPVWGLWSWAHFCLPVSHFNRSYVLTWVKYGISLHILDAFALICRPFCTTKIT